MTGDRPGGGVGRLDADGVWPVLPFRHGGAAGAVTQIVSAHNPSLGSVDGDGTVSRALERHYERGPVVVELLGRERVRDGYRLVSGTFECEHLALQRARQRRRGGCGCGLDRTG